MSVILVTGGAGYIGAHVCYALHQAGHSVIVYDNLSTGHGSFVKWGPFEYGDIRDKWRLRVVMETHAPDAVIHCAARSEVGASIVDPSSFYDVNVAGTLTLLDVMREAECKAFVLSSSCAIYGPPQPSPSALPLTGEGETALPTPPPSRGSIDEAHPQAPLSPYGRSKQMAEHLSADFADAYGLSFAHLRYFNAAGSAAHEGIGESHHPETHAIPLALRATTERPFIINGDCYPTSDGTCVRDYVHVLDLASAHVKAAEHLLSGRESLVLNLGSGSGVSVKQLVEAIGAPFKIGPPRQGDAASLVADISLAQKVLGWTPKRSFLDIISSAASWETVKNPTNKLDRDILR